MNATTAKLPRGNIYTWLRNFQHDCDLVFYVAVAAFCTPCDLYVFYCVQRMGVKHALAKRCPDAANTEENPPGRGTYLTWKNYAE